MHPAQYRMRLFDKPDAEKGGGAPAEVPNPPPAPAPSASDPPPTGAAASVPATPPADPTPAAPPKADWRDARIAKLTHDLNEERRQRAAAPPAVPPAPPVRNDGETEEAFNARVNERAAQIAAQNDWDRRCNAVAEQGRKEFPDGKFDERLNAVMKTVNFEDAGEVRAYNEVIAAAMETADPHKVIYALGADPGEYQKLMRLSPVKRAMEIAKLSAGVVNDPAPSGAPKPITPISSSGAHYEAIAPDDPSKGMKLPKAEWYKQREAQARERGIQ